MAASILICQPAATVVKPSPGKRIEPPYLKPGFGVFAVAAAGVLCAFPPWWTHYLNSVSAAGPEQISLSLLFLELSGYCVNAVQLHVNAAEVLVRRGIDGKVFDLTLPSTMSPEGTPPWTIAAKTPPLP